MNAQELNTPPSVEYHYSEKNGVSIQLTQFGDPEDREWHLLLSVTDPLLDFQSQLKQVFDTYRAMVSHEHGHLNPCRGRAVDGRPWIPLFSRGTATRQRNESGVMGVDALPRREPRFGLRTLCREHAARHMILGHRAGRGLWHLQRADCTHSSAVCDDAYPRRTYLAR